MSISRRCRSGRALHRIASPRKIPKATMSNKGTIRKASLFRSMQEAGIEPRHYHRHPEPNDDHRRTESRPRPAESSVELHFPDSHQPRLHEVKSDPTGEKGGMHPEQNRSSRVSLNELISNGAAESIKNDYRD